MHVFFAQANNCARTKPKAIIKKSDNDVIYAYGIPGRGALKFLPETPERKREALLKGLKTYNLKGTYVSLTARRMKNEKGSPTIFVVMPRDDVEVDRASFKDVMAQYKNHLNQFPLHNNPWINSVDSNDSDEPL